MKRLVIPVLALAASCSSPSEKYGFVARLGKDTVSLERVKRDGSTITSDEVDRFPRVRRRHTILTLAPDGTIRHLEMDINSPSEAPGQRDRHVVADVTSDSVHITKRDSTGTKNIAFATEKGVLTMPHLPQMYSLTDLYFASALRRADSTKLAAGDSIRLRQYYIDREFDRFPLHDGFVRPHDGNKAELWHDWLSGVADATFDSTHRMLTYSGQRTTYKVDVRRLGPDDLPDVKLVGDQFAAAESRAGGMKQLSVRDTMRANIGSVAFTIDYGRPLARGRDLLREVLQTDHVWRTGANAATQFTTSAPITIGNMKVPAGKYTLWTVPRKDGRAELIINKQSGQWGTEYNEKEDLGTIALKTETVTAPVEKFTFSIASTDPKHGALVLEWGTFRWTAPIAI